MVGERRRDNRFVAATVAFVVYTLVMLLLERRMRATGGPGIIPFELAGSAIRAEDIMTRWGSDGQRAARLSLRLDFGYMATYGTFTALLVDGVRRRRAIRRLSRNCDCCRRRRRDRGSLVAERTSPHASCR